MPSNYSTTFLVSIDGDYLDIEPTIYSIEKAIDRLTQMNPNNSVEVIFIINSLSEHYIKIIKNHVCPSYKIKVLQRNPISIAKGAPFIFGSILAEGETVIYIPVTSNIQDSSICELYTKYSEVLRQDQNSIMVAGDNNFSKTKLSQILQQLLHRNVGNPFIGIAAITRKTITHIISGMRSEYDEDFVYELMLSCHMLGFRIETYNLTGYFGKTNGITSLLIALKYTLAYKFHVWNAVPESTIDPTSKLYF
ncbi:hypothetical protein TVAG_250650 [Trichomonas vaginalis G3]|uniref:Uncharacterized protein n=1 Tax=Trichomonas vaginalis (strain ATCC PRA-98 / G3) TaxID=412133 RepID=A2ESR4_TRIV3|nr:hypothetical protein TVAGG3_0826370 [Trichomonas vaginalis G3]EAY04305.1 hypothetical protein TVAG_250650 [Trichomonas vaginalis G3]KAI5498266.1 hypothetical protein TVAGG3_0826370 [Trichomonas vaginalis G3]|eukprot:XP_001316528.1 hypothetical protein [Trichomonas vaginalis G3]